MSDSEEVSRKIHPFFPVRSCLSLSLFQNVEETKQVKSKKRKTFDGNADGDLERANESAPDEEENQDDDDDVNRLRWASSDALTYICLGRRRRRR